MKNLLILGAGLSATTMIRYLLNKSTENQWNITVGDVSLSTALSKTQGFAGARAIEFDIHNEQQKMDEIGKADVVISFLPSFLHSIVAKECLKQKKHMVTASYVSPEMKALVPEVTSAGLIFLNELGVDPGIDHMSAMKVIDHIRSMGGEILSFTSNTGGLVAPESDNNPWHYKFTWNPRNVVLAGQAVSKYIEEGTYKYVPYHQLFTRTTRSTVLNYGDFEIYPNRDSLAYREIYGLQNIPTLMRGTFRRPGYCEAWNTFVALGVTDDTYQIEGVSTMTWREFFNSYLPYDESLSLEQKMARFIRKEENSEIMQKLKWLGVFDKSPVGLDKATPAQILQKLLESKWVLDPNDKDMIVMQHKFVYKLNGKKKEIISSMAVIGKDTSDTAMAITVGMPVAIATEMLMKGRFAKPGVHIPVVPELYLPILEKLDTYEVRFVEEERDL